MRKDDKDSVFGGGGALILLIIMYFSRFNNQDSLIWLWVTFTLIASTEPLKTTFKERFKDIFHKLMVHVMVINCYYNICIVRYMFFLVK